MTVNDVKPKATRRRAPRVKPSVCPVCPVMSRVRMVSGLFTTKKDVMKLLLAFILGGMVAIGAITPEIHALLVQIIGLAPPPSPY